MHQTSQLHRILPGRPQRQEAGWSRLLQIILLHGMQGTLSMWSIDDREGSMAEKGIKKTKKIAFAKPGNFLYPVPAVMVSCAGSDQKPNIFTVAWAGTICTNPPMVSISVRKERYSY